MINTFLEMAMTGFHQNRVGNCPTSNKCKKSLSINFLIKRETLNLNFNIIFLTLTRKKISFLIPDFLIFQATVQRTPIEVSQLERAKEEEAKFGYSTGQTIHQASL